MKIDASPQGSGDFDPGVYLVEVRACELKHSKKKQAYFNVRLHDASTHGSGELVCFDVIMLEGNGRGMGISKLKVLGFQEVMEQTIDGPKPIIDAEPEDLVGHRFWVRVGWNDYEGKRRLQVVAQFDPVFESGYWHENTPPDDTSSSVFEPELPAPAPARAATQKASDTDDVPF